MEEEGEISFWQESWAWIKKAARTIAAPLPAILLIVGAVILLILGVKNVQIGGLLGKLLGKDKPEASGKVVDVANTVPEGRVDAKGNIIPIGTPDAQGVTQAKVVPIEAPSIFDDPTQVRIIPPGKTEPVIVDLPEGVKAKDIDKVIMVQPEVYVVSVKDTSKVDAKKVDDLLAKYGG